MNCRLQTGTPSARIELMRESFMLKKIKSFLLMTLGCLILAVGVYFFKIPNGFVTGGVSGLATLLGKLISNVEALNWLTTSLMIIILNGLLLVVGFIFVNKSFGFKTIYCTLAYSALTYLFEWLFPEENVLKLFSTTALPLPLTSQPLLELVFAILLTAIGSAILFNSDASSGGTDILAMILKKYTSLNVGTALLLADCVIAFSSFFVYKDVTVGLFSVLGLFSKSFFVDGIIENLNMCKYFTIITEKADEICAFVLQDMHRGVTRHEAEGAFSHMPKTVLLTVCNRHEAHVLKAKIKEVDPAAFIMVTNSSEILGRGFRSL